MLQVANTRVGPRAAEPRTRYRASLRVVGLGQSVELRGERVTIGSDANCDLRLEDPFVSKHHCTLSWDRGELVLQDAGSRNGTWVNNLRVTRCGLDPRARIDIGRTRLAVEPSGAVAHEANLHGLVGDHPRMLEVYRRIERFARGDYPVLVSGETGTGKELVARAIHEASRVATGPFEAINCAAIPRELAESELFGHVRGAFTGAVESFAGAFQRAEGGSLFLDEVGEMPLELQPKLLRVLEDGVIRAVGSDAQRPTRVRLLAATHRDLSHEADRGHFRQDLYFRLAVGFIPLPPLRERSSDVPALLRHFVARESRGGKRPRLERGLAPWLSRQTWPGNVRALRHAVQRAMALCERELLCKVDFIDSADRPLAQPDDGLLALRGKSFLEIRQEVYKWALDVYGNRAQAARSLDIPKSTFNDQLRSLGLR
jgi:DNA-binding NtrC family response regulator